MQYCPDYFQDFDPSGGCWNLIAYLIEICSVNVVFINAFGAYRKSSVERFVVYNYLDFSFLFLNSFNQRKNLNRNCRFIKLFLKFFLFVIKEKVTKICDQDGNWFRHPDSNRTWTNYTLCNNSTHEKVKVCSSRELKSGSDFKTAP